ncbi:glycosyltransferase family 4 protein [Halovenus sp. HT40]|uniref:glycosyltransferase family 4 protein n=1 Tax=Halovenus sp. HT40 TaxID=3126691 RepID=UPI00300F0F0F
MTDNDTLTTLLLSGSVFSGNPNMTLLSEGLERAGTEVRCPDNKRVFPATQAALRNRDADILQIDWPYPHYLIRNSDSDALNKIFTVLRAVTFLLDLLVVSVLPIKLVRVVHNKRHHEKIYPRVERVVNELNFLVADAITVKCTRAGDIVDSHYTAASVDKMHVIPDGNYIPAYENTVSMEVARDELSIPDDEFVFLFFGHIREYKGVPDLLETFPDLDRSDARLWIVGNPKTDDLEAEITALAQQDDVETVLEYIPDDRVQYYMNAADVLVLPYRDILNSGAVYAGLSFGLPVVTPAIGCLPETVPPENEFLYDPTRDRALLQELERAYDQPDLASIGRANYEYAQDQSWDRVAQRVTDMYRSTLDGQNGSQTATSALDPQDTTS